MFLKKPLVTAVLVVILALHGVAARASESDSNPISLRKLAALQDVPPVNCSLLEDQVTLTCTGYSGTTLPYQPDEHASVTEVQLTGNFTEVHLDAAYQTQLEVIQLQSSAMPLFKLGWLSDFSRLQRLEIRPSLLRTFDARDYSGLDGLTMISVASNQVAEIQGSLEALYNLQTLDVYWNVLPSFNFSILPPSVRLVSLSHNLIQTMDTGRLRELADLRHLSVDSNRLESFDFAVLPANLRYLLLQNNNISRLRNIGALSDVSIDVTGNPVSCTCALLHEFAALQSSSAEPVACQGYDAASSTYRACFRCGGDSELTPDAVYTDDASELVERDEEECGVPPAEGTCRRASSLPVWTFAGVAAVVAFRLGK